MARTTGSMDRRSVMLAGAGAALAPLVSEAQTPDPEKAPGMRVMRNVMVPMRDGVRLATDIYLPADGGPFPVLLARTPYNKNLGLGPAGPVGLVARGYAVVMQDKRGRYASEGFYRPEFDDGVGPRKDGYDTVEWVAAQAWCNRKVGMWGGSYLGHTTISACMAAPPHLLSGVSTRPATDSFSQTGIFNLGICGWNEMQGPDWLAKFTDPQTRAQAEAELELVKADRAKAMRTLPLIEMPYQRFLTTMWAEPLEHRDDPGFFENRTTAEKFSHVQTPILHIGGWFDPFLNNTLKHYRLGTTAAATEHARKEQRLIVGPWIHGAAVNEKVGEIAFPNQMPDYDRLMTDFQDIWLKDAPPRSYHQYPAIIYVMGANRWRGETQWPPAAAVEKAVFLRRGGSMSFEAPGAESGDSYDSDPNHPYSGPSFAGGPRDASAALKGANLLVYTSPPLERDVEIVGPVGFDLYAASTGTDTDWIVELHEVLPDGRSMVMTEGAIRARFRKSRFDPEPIEPGRVERYKIDLRSTEFPPIVTGLLNRRKSVSTTGGT